MEAIDGTPSLTAVGTYTLAWAMDAAAVETIGDNIHIPTGWATFDVTVIWANLGSGSGDVVFQLFMQSLDDGTSISGVNHAIHGPTAFTAAAQSVVEHSKIASAISTTGLRDLHLRRVGSNAGDTLANDAGVLGIYLTKVS